MSNDEPTVSGAFTFAVVTAIGVAGLLFGVCVAILDAW
jgi:hypothetical protein